MKQLLALLLLPSLAVAQVAWNGVDCTAWNGVNSPSWNAAGETCGVEAPTPDIWWWKYPDGSGTTVTAAVAPNGTTDMIWATGQSGSGFSLENDGELSAATVSAVTYGTNKITVCFWLNRSTAVAVTSIVDSGTNPYDSAGKWSIGQNGSSFQVYMTSSGAQHRLETCTTTTEDTWVHVLVVLDATTANGDILVYFDGVSQSTSVDDNTKTGTSDFSANSVGVMGNLAGDALWTLGKIDDTRIYTGDRSADVVAIMADSQ